MYRAKELGKKSKGEDIEKFIKMIEDIGGDGRLNNKLEKIFEFIKLLNKNNREIFNKFFKSEWVNKENFYLKKISIDISLVFVLLFFRIKERLLTKQTLV
jgi:hypothetical protein